MSCRELERLFLLEPETSAIEAREHRASCRACEALGAEIDSLTRLVSSLNRPAPGTPLVSVLLAIPRETVHCEEADRLLALSLEEEEIPATDRRRLDSHLSRCESCRAAGETLLALRGLAAPEPAPWLAARIAASRPRRRRSFWKALRSPKGAIAFAYAAAVVVMLAGFNPADLARKAGAGLEADAKSAVTAAGSSLADRLGALEEEALRKLAVWKGRVSGYGRAALSSAIQLVMKTESQPPPRPRSGEEKRVPKNETSITTWRA